MNSIIIATGSYIPTKIIPNKDFLKNKFYNSDRKIFNNTNKEIVDKFEKITGISERRYVESNLVTSDIAYIAAKDALESSKIDPESLDYIILAHNFGDMREENKRSDFVPSLASRVKEKLKIINPETICYDVAFGCPGWLMGMIQGDYYLRSGDVKRVLVIGAETLSRISDPHDRDSMIYADGAGATILEAASSSDNERAGIMAHAARTDAQEYAYMLKMGRSFNPNDGNNSLYLKMNGHKLYEYALLTVPHVVKKSIEKAGLTLPDIKKIFLHQANAKMDNAILERLCKICGEKEIPPDIMPMTISWLGNSSVATIPTLLDLVLKEKLDNHRLNKGDIIVFASVGAGMNINSMVYRM